MRERAPGWQGATVDADLPLLGFGMPVSGSWATPDTMLMVARRAEELGYASLWTFQRLLAPDPADRPRLSPRTEHAPAGRPADDPAYRMVHDAVLPLAYVAGHTRRIGLGTATLCAPFTPPVALAKAMTTLDHLTGGRLTVGLGIGWLREEYVAAGVPFARRGERMEEYLRCLEALWTHDPVEFAGEFYTVPRSHAGPRPVQRPHPPVLLGGDAPAALRRAGRLAQGWICSSRRTLSDLERSVALVREGAHQAGRNPDELRVVARAQVHLVEDEQGPTRVLFHGTREQILADVAAFRGRGATEVFVDLNFSPGMGPDADAGAATTEALRVLDALAPAHLSR